MANKLDRFWKLGIENFNTQYFDINKDGNLVVKEGNYQYDVMSLVKKFNTPAEIVFPYILEERLDNLINLFNSYIKIYRYPGKFFYHYPMKVNQNKEFVLPLVTEGANLETGSANELKLVKKMWENQNLSSKIKVVCNGPKTKEYLDIISELKSKDLDVIPIIEDLNEYEYLLKYRGNVGIRLEVEARVKSHWSKEVDRFGLTDKEIKQLGKIKNLKVLHYHIGSQIELLKDVMTPLRKAMETYLSLKLINPSLETIDIGGGMPIPYDRKFRYSVDSLIESIIKFLFEFSKKNNIPPPNIACEWGRYIVAPAQITIFKVLAEKEIPGSKNRRWYVVDGSFMNDLLDTWAIHQKWHVIPVNHMNAKKRTQSWLAGMTCDSDDKYTGQGSYVLLPRLSDITGDEGLYLAILDSGAYQDALASHHCLLSSPVKLLAQNGEVKIIRRRETLDDVAKLFGW
jgi:arginine decarboxylase